MQDMSDCQAARQTPLLCHFTFWNVGKSPNHRMKYNAVGTMQGILIPSTIIANRFDVKVYGTGLLKQLSFCCLQRCFSGFNMTTLRFPCGSFFVPAQNNFSMALGKNNHIFVIFQSIYLVGFTTHDLCFFSSDFLFRSGSRRSTFFAASASQFCRLHCGELVRR